MVRGKITFAMLYLAAACAWAGNPVVQPVTGSSMQAHPWQPPSPKSYAPATRVLAPVIPALTLTQPSSNPYASTNPSLVISGTYLGDKYQFPLLYKTKAATYTYAVFANDAHGNLVKRFYIT